MANRMPGLSPIRGTNFSMASTQTRFHTSSNVSSWAAAAAHQPSQTFGMANMTGFTMMQSVDPFGSSYSVTQVASATAFVGGVNQQSTMVQTVVQETRIQAGVGGTFAIPNGFRPLRPPQPGGPRFQRPGGPTMANHGAHLQSLLSSTRFGMSSSVRLYPQTGPFGGSQPTRNQQPGTPTEAIPDQRATSPRPAADSPSWPKLSPATGTALKDEEPSSTQPAPAWRKRPAAPAEPSKFAKRPSPRPSWPSLGKPAKSFPRVPQRESTPSFPTPRQKSPGGRPSGPGPTSTRTSPISDYNFNPSWLRPSRPTAPPTPAPKEPKPPQKPSRNSKEKKSSTLLTEDPPLVPPKNKTLPGFSPAEATDPPVVNQWTAGGGLKWGEVLKKKEEKAEVEKKKKFSLEKEEFPPLLGDTPGSKKTGVNCWEKGKMKLLTESEQKSEGKKGDARNQQDAKKQKSKPEAGLNLVVLGSTGKGAALSAPKARTGPQRAPEEPEVVKQTLAWVAESLVKVPSADAKVDIKEKPGADIISNQADVIQEIPQPPPASVAVSEPSATSIVPEPTENEPPRSLSWAQRVAGIPASRKESASSDLANLEHQQIEDLSEPIAVASNEKQQQFHPTWIAEEFLENSKKEIKEFTEPQEEPKPETKADPLPSIAMPELQNNAVLAAEVVTSADPQWYDPFVSAFPSWIPPTVQQGIFQATSAVNLEQHARHQAFQESQQPAIPSTEEDWSSSFTDVFNRHLERCQLQEESRQQPLSDHVPELQTTNAAELGFQMQYQQPEEPQTQLYIRPPPGLPPPGIDFEYPLHVIEELNGRRSADEIRQASAPAAADGLPATVAGDYGSAATLMKKLSCLEAGLPQHDDRTSSAESVGGPQKKRNHPRLPTWLEQWEEQWQKAQQEAKEHERLARVNHPVDGHSWNDFNHPSLEQENFFPGQNLEAMDTGERQATPPTVGSTPQQNYGLNSARHEILRMSEDYHDAGDINFGRQVEEQQVLVNPYATTGQPNSAYRPEGASWWGVWGTDPFQSLNQTTQTSAAQPAEDSYYYTTTSRRRRRKRKPRARPAPPSSPRQNGVIPFIQQFLDNRQGHERFMQPSSPHHGEEVLVSNSLGNNGPQPFDHHACYQHDHVEPSFAGNPPTVEATTDVVAEEHWNRLLSFMVAQSMYDPDSPEFLTATAGQEPVYPEQYDDPSEADYVRSFSSVYDQVHRDTPSSGENAAAWCGYLQDQDAAGLRPDISPNHDSERNSLEDSEIEEANSDGFTAESLGVTEADLEMFRRVRRMLLDSADQNTYEGDLLRRYQESGDDEDPALQHYENYPGTDSNVESSQSAAEMDVVQQIEENLQRGAGTSFSDNHIFASAVASGQIDLQRSWSVQSTWTSGSLDPENETANEVFLEKQDGIIDSPPNVVDIPGSFLLKATEINQLITDSVTDSLEPTSRAVREDCKEVSPELQPSPAEPYNLGEEEEGEEQQPPFISDLAEPPVSSNGIGIEDGLISINAQPNPVNQPAADMKNQQNILDNITGEDQSFCAPEIAAGASKRDIQKSQTVLPSITPPPGADVDSGSDEQEGSDHIGQGDGVNVGQVQGAQQQPVASLYPQYAAAGGDHQYSGLALQRENLVYILAVFYKFGPMHLAAAEELYRRKWRFHKAMGVWMIGKDGRSPLGPRRHLFSITENPYMAIRSVKYFDAVAWSMKIEEKFFLRFADLEMQRPSLGGHIHPNSYYHPSLQGDTTAPSDDNHGRVHG